MTPEAMLIAGIVSAWIISTLALFFALCAIVKILAREQSTNTIQYVTKEEKQALAKELNVPLAEGDIQEEVRSDPSEDVRKQIQSLFNNPWGV